jgi:hypothetical protein
MSTHGGNKGPSTGPATSVVGPDAYGAPAAVGVGTSYARNDHDHGLPAAPGGGGGLLASVEYAPAVEVQYTSSADTPTVIDATNLTISFVAPASGKVLVRLSGAAGGGGASATSWCLLDHTSSVQLGYTHVVNSSVSSIEVIATSIPILLTGLTPNTTYQVDWAYLCAGAGSASYLYVQGGTGLPSTAYAGPATMEVWSA